MPRRSLVPAGSSTTFRCGLAVAARRSAKTSSPSTSATPSSSGPWPPCSSSSAAARLATLAAYASSVQPAAGVNSRSREIGSSTVSKRFSRFHQARRSEGTPSVDQRAELPDRQRKPGEVGLALPREGAQEVVEPGGLAGMVVQEVLDGHERLGARALAQRALGQLAAGLEGILAHRLKRPPLHTGGRANAGELSLHPVEPELGSDREEDAGDVLDRAVGAGGHGHHVGRVDQLGSQRVRARHGLGHALAGEPPDRLLATSAALLGAEAGQYGGQPLEAVAAGGDRLLERGARGQVRYQ